MFALLTVSMSVICLYSALLFLAMYRQSKDRAFAVFSFIAFSGALVTFLMGLFRHSETYVWQKALHVFLSIFILIGPLFVSKLGHIRVNRRVFLALGLSSAVFVFLPFHPEFANNPHKFTAQWSLYHTGTMLFMAAFAFCLLYMLYIVYSSKSLKTTPSMHKLILFSQTVLVFSYSADMLRVSGVFSSAMPAMPAGFAFWMLSGMFFMHARWSGSLGRLRNMEEELFKYKGLWHSIRDDTEQRVFLLDLGLRFVEVSNGFAKSMGYGKEDFLGGDFHTFFEPIAPKAENAFMEEAEKGDFAGRYRIFSKTEGLCTANMHLLRLKGGREYFGIVRDLRPLEENRNSFITKELTERESEVLELLSLGLNNNEIGGRLFISPHTVKTHTKRIYGKLGVHKRAELLAMLEKKRRAG